MMLDKLVRTYIRRAKIIVILWVIIVLISIPLALQLDKAIEYHEEKFIPKTLESYIGEEILKTYFNMGKTEENYTVILLPLNFNSSDYEKHKQFREILDLILDEKNLTEYVIRIYSPVDIFDYIREGYDSMMESICNRTFTYVKGNITYYNKLLSDVKNYTVLLHYGLYETYDKLYQLGYGLYEVPNIYVKYWIQVFNKYYVPKYPSPKFDIYKVSDLAYGRLKAYLSIRLGEQYSNITFYLDKFVDKWKKSFKTAYPDPSEINNVTLNRRLLFIVSNVIAEIISDPLTPPQIKVILIRYTTLIPVTVWNNLTMRDERLVNLTIDLVYENIQALIGNLTIENFNITKDVLYEIFALGKPLTEEKLRDFILSKAYEIAPEYEEYFKRLYYLGRNPSKTSLNVLASYITNKIMEEIYHKYPPPNYPDYIIDKFGTSMITSDGYSVLMVIYCNKTVDLDLMIQILRHIIDFSISRGLLVEGYVTGNSVIFHDIGVEMKRDASKIDKFTVIAVISLLSLLLASAIAPILPLITIGSAIIIAQALLYILATYFGFSVHYLSRSFLVTVMMGAGVDYAVYIIYRYFEERAKGSTQITSIYRAGKFGGEAVISSGATVMAGFGSIAASRVGVLNSVGLSLMLGILIALITAVIVVPSLVYILGDRITWPRREPPKGIARAKLLRKAASYSVSKPWIIIIIFIVLTLVLLYPVSLIKRSYDFMGVIPGLESKVGYDYIIENFGARYLSKIDVVFELSTPAIINDSINPQVYEILEKIIRSIEFLEGIDKKNIYGLTRPNGKYVSYENITLNDVKDYVSRDGRFIRYSLGILALPTSEEAINLIKQVRSELKEVISKELISNVVNNTYVTGLSALTYDLLAVVDEDFYNRIIPMVIISIYLILLVLLRSVLIPVRLIFTILMSVAWAIGSLVLLFQFTMGTYIYWIIPILLFSLLMGLGMDYDIFLVSRIKEEVGRGASDEEATIRGVESTGQVITACGLILASALATLITSTNLILVESGFTLSIAIIYDTFLVRIFLVPSIMMLLKKWNWWPSYPKVREEIIE